MPTEDSAGVVAKPPKLYLASVTVGLALEWWRPLPFLPAGVAWRLGPALVALGVALMVWAMRTFAAAGTPVPTDLPVTAVVQGGPYRYSRNPIYVSLTLLHLGVACWANTAWLLATLGVLLVVMRYGVIAREERYLAGKFGAEYEAYRGRVRRWL